MVLARIREHTSPYLIPNILTPLLPASSFQTWSTQVSFLELLSKTQREFILGMYRSDEHLQELYTHVRLITTSFLKASYGMRHRHLQISSIITTIVNDVLTIWYEFLHSTALNMCTLTIKHVAEKAQYNLGLSRAISGYLKISLAIPYLCLAILRNLWRSLAISLAFFVLYLSILDYLWLSLAKSSGK